MALAKCEMDYWQLGRITVRFSETIVMIFLSLHIEYVKTFTARADVR